jgi:pimeloyl-ACP methyl ester carboxylesterase
MTDIIVLLPGIGGSVLKKDGRDLWALSGDAALRELLSGGQALNELTLGDDPPDADDLGDGITADRLMNDVHLIPYFWKIDGYSKVADTLKASFDVTPGQNYFEFAYDWRRDNRVAARRLAQEGQRWLTSWRASSGNSKAKLILIAHSMGGIVSRYFLERHEGWRNTKALITFGTPYRGSLNALDTLANGIKKGPLDLSPMMRSLTAAYQLLPTYQCYDPGTGNLICVDEPADIPNLPQQRAAAALAFHKEIENAVKEHQTDEAYMRDGYKIFPIVGIEQPTMQSARLSGARVEILPTYLGQDLTGDGTVPRVSATPRELSDQHREMFAATRHASLQNADATLVQLRGVISDLYLNLGMFRAPLPGVRLGLDLEDVYWTDEPVSIRVRPKGDPMTLHATVVNTDTGTEIARAPLQPGGDGWQRAEFRPLPTGTYRVAVTGEDRVEPVADVFTVFAHRA